MCKITLSIICLVLYKILSLNLAFAASFDCSKASTTIEIAICKDDVLSKLDEEMGQLYLKILSTQGNEFRKKQIGWIKKRNEICDEDTACLKFMILQRITLFTEILKIPTVPQESNTQSISDIGRTQNSNKETPTASFVPASESCDNIFGLKMIYIPEGNVIIGDNASYFYDERPEHSVSMSSFCIMESKFTKKDLENVVNVVGNIDLAIEASSVSDYQKILHDLRYYQGTIDGDFGPRSIASLIQFQRDNKLPPSGELDTFTKDALNKNLRNRSLQEIIDELPGTEDTYNFMGQETAFLTVAETEYLTNLLEEMGHSLRLPSEAEWQYAVGSAFDEVGVCSPEDDFTFMERFNPQNFGLKELDGNWELTSSFYRPYPLQTVDDNARKSKQFRVLRGGSIFDPRMSCLNLKGFSRLSAKRKFRLVLY